MYARRTSTTPLRHTVALQSPQSFRPAIKIIKFKSDSKKGDFLCAICGGGRFWYTAHLKSHFLTYVKGYGNPKGAN